MAEVPVLEITTAVVETRHPGSTTERTSLIVCNTFQQIKQGRDLIMHVSKIKLHQRAVKREHFNFYKQLYNNMT